MAFIHLNITIKGRVQGVGFRMATQQAATSMGVTGNVRNLPDGSVYVEVEGAEKNVAEFLKWCHQGPPAARVEEVSSAEGQRSNFTVFEIKRDR